MSRPINPEITDEEREKKKEYQRRYLEKKAQKIKEEAIADNNWQALYEDAQKTINTLTAKIEQYEQICASYAKKENEYKMTLQRAAIEYDARVKYIADCIKHAYLSTQFAINSQKSEGTKND